MKLSRKILLLVTVITLSVGLGSVFLVGTMMDRALYEELSKRGEYTVLTLAEVYTNFVVNREVIPVVEGIKWLVQEQDDIDYVYFMDFDGKVLAHSFADGFPKELLSVWDAEPKNKYSSHYTDASSGQYYVEFRQPLN